MAEYIDRGTAIANLIPVERCNNCKYLAKDDE